MKAAVEAFKDVGAADRAVIVSGENRLRLEALLEMPISEPSQLVKLVEGLCTVKVAGIEVNFTLDQLTRIQAQAEFHGKSSEQFISEMVSEIIARFSEEY
jgi:uncharacterized protein (DUF1778 family)